MIQKYIQSRHKVDNRYVLVAPTTQEEIVDLLKYMLSLKEEGLNLFFTDIDKIKEMMLKELVKSK